MRDDASEPAEPTAEEEREAVLAELAGSASDTPRTSAALAATLESCGWLKREAHGPLVDLARELEREVAHWQIVARYNQATSTRPDERLRFLLAEVVRCVPIIEPRWRQSYLYQQCAAACEPNGSREPRNEGTQHGD